MSVVYLHRTLFGRVSLWPAASSLFVYNYMLMAGFISYALGIALALLFLAFWIRLQYRPTIVRISIGILLAFLIYFTHLLAFAIYAVSVGVFHLWQLLGRRRAFRGAFAAGCIAVVPLLLPLALFLVSSDFLGSLGAAGPSLDLARPPALDTASGGVELLLTHLTDRLRWLRTLGTGYSKWLDLLVVMSVTVVLAYAAFQRALSLYWPVLSVALLFAAVYLVLPNREIFHTYLLQVRFPVVVVLLLLASTDFRLRGPSAGIVLSGGAILFATQIAVISANWYAYRAELAEFRRAFAIVESGAKVFSVRADGTPGKIFRTEPARQAYLGSLLVLHQLQTLMIAERGAYSPYFFTNPQKHLLRVREPYRDIDYTEGGVPTPWSWARDVLAEPDGQHDFLKSAIWAPTRDWWLRYDYVSFLYPSHAKMPLQGIDGVMQLVFQGRWINLYRTAASKTGRRADRIEEQ